MTVTPEMLIAYVDGEADAQTVAAIESEAASNPQLAAEIARYRAARNRVSAAFAGAVQEPVPKRLVEAVMAGESENVVDLAARRGRSQAFVAAGGIAATLVLGFILTSQLVDRTVPIRDPAQNAPLAIALEKGLASDPVSADAIRIGVTFKSSSSYCRTFQMPAQDQSPDVVAGVACRGKTGWHVEAAARQPSTPGEYRTAAGLPQLVVRTIEALNLGDPLDADAEARARDKGWR